MFSGAYRIFRPPQHETALSKICARAQEAKPPTSWLRWVWLATAQFRGFWVALARRTPPSLPSLVGTPFGRSLPGFSALGIHEHSVLLGVLFRVNETEVPHTPGFKQVIISESKCQSGAKNGDCDSALIQNNAKTFQILQISALS